MLSGFCLDSANRMLRPEVRSRRRKSGGLHSPFTFLLGHGMTLLFPPATGLSSCPPTPPPVIPSHSTAWPHSLRPTPYTVLSPGDSSVLALSPRGCFSEGSPFEPATFGFLPWLSKASSHPPSCRLGGGRNTAVNKANKTPSLMELAWSKADN